MTKLARVQIGAVALALVAAGTSCGQQRPQKPQNQAQQAQPQQSDQQPQAQQAQNQAQQTGPQPQAQQPQNQAQQTEPQAQQAQNQAQQTEPQQPQAQQAQPGQPPANENSNQNGSQNTVENPSPGKIRQIQQALEQKGFKVGYPDGKLGPMTKRALSQFQRKQGLQRTGMPDEQTLGALGIGGGASNTGQGPSGSGGIDPNQAPSNNPSARPRGQ